MSSSVITVPSPEELMRRRIAEAAGIRENIVIKASGYIERVSAYDAGKLCSDIIREIVSKCESICNRGLSNDIDTIERENLEFECTLDIIKNVLFHTSLTDIFRITRLIEDAESFIKSFKSEAGSNTAMVETSKRLEETYYSVYNSISKSIPSQNIFNVTEDEINRIYSRMQLQYNKFCKEAEEAKEFARWKKEREEEIRKISEVTDFTPDEVMSADEFRECLKTIDNSAPRIEEVNRLISISDRFVLFSSDKKRLKDLAVQYSKGSDNAIIEIKQFLVNICEHPISSVYNAYCYLTQKMGTEPLHISSFSSLKDLNRGLDAVRMAYTNKIEKSFVRKAIQDTLQEMGFKEIDIKIEDREGIMVITDNNNSFIFNDSQDYLYLESCMIKKPDTPFPSSNEIIEYRSNGCKVIEMFRQRLTAHGIKIEEKNTIPPRVENFVVIDHKEDKAFDTANHNTKKTFKASYDD